MKRVVFDTSPKTVSGASLNNQFLVGPTLHPPLIDVLMCFRRHKIALTTDISTIYRAFILPTDHRYLHRFVRREDHTQPLRDYRKTWLTFIVSVPPFDANMVIKQNVLMLKHKYQYTAQVALDCFYVDDDMVGADSVADVICLRDKLQRLFAAGEFRIKNWKTREKTVEEKIPVNLCDHDSTQRFTYTKVFTKVLSVKWNAMIDSSRFLVPANCEISGDPTKWQLLSKWQNYSMCLAVARQLSSCPRCLYSIFGRKSLVGARLSEWTSAKFGKKWISTITKLREFSMPRSYFPKEANRQKLSCAASEIPLKGFSQE